MGKNWLAGKKKSNQRKNYFSRRKKLIFLKIFYSSTNLTRLFIHNVISLLFFMLQLDSIR